MIIESEPEIIHRLEGFYVPMFQKLFNQSQVEAQSMFDGLIEKAKADSQKKKLGAIDKNTLLRLAQTNPKVHAELELKKQEGVRDEDLRWWWDMPDLERQFFIQMDFIHRAGYYKALRVQGIPKDEASRIVNQANPSYVEFSDMCSLPKDEDFPLPIELRDRVNRRVEEEAARDPSGAEWKAYRSQFSSFNALARHEIAEGKL